MVVVPAATNPGAIDTTDCSNGNSVDGCDWVVGPPLLANGYRFALGAIAAAGALIDAAVCAGVAVAGGGGIEPMLLVPPPQADSESANANDEPTIDLRNCVMRSSSAALRGGQQPR
jgi:hypothetical protein